MTFPRTRPRRLRRTAALRNLVRETRLGPENFIAPLFVVAGRGRRETIATLPGHSRFSPDLAAAEAAELRALGIPAVLLFGIPDHKDASGSSAFDPEGPAPQAIRAIKAASPETVVITDVCLCEYTDHGHCGVVAGNEIDNDATLPLLSRMAVAHARAGADIVAPSDMMDGRVAAIRAALDAEGFTATAILAYAAKMASSFYGPFREAAGSAPRFGDRKSYQMDGANLREALREIALDEAEGADLVMVKPALACLDVIAAARAETRLPLVAYSVSGEYAMVLSAAEKGVMDADAAMREILLAIRRAGADLIVTYHARRAAEQMRAGEWP